MGLRKCYECGFIENEEETMMEGELELEHMNVDGEWEIYYEFCLVCPQCEARADAIGEV